MASSYPTSLDTSFPGYPYADNVQYVEAAYADAWVLAIQAVEKAIGAGSGTSANNPLYSTVFAESFSTITARIANAELVAKNSQVVIDPSPGDIQPVVSSTVGSEAGETGKAADAGHAHVGVHSVNGQTGDIEIAVQQVTENVYNISGEIVCGTGNGTGECLPPSTDQCHLECDSTQPCGVRWRQKGEVTHVAGDCKKVSYCQPYNGWIFAHGQQCSRTTYPNLFLASIVQFTGINFTTSSKTISGLNASLTAFIALGMAVECAGYFPSGVTVTAVTSTTVTLSNFPTSSGNSTVNIFLFGNGDGVTTFNCVNVPDTGDGTHTCVKAD